MVLFIVGIEMGESLAFHKRMKANASIIGKILVYNSALHVLQFGRFLRKMKFGDPMIQYSRN